MGIGAMNKKVTILQPVRTPDGQGGRATNFEPVCSVWAEFLRPNVKTAESAGAIISELLRKIIIWKRSDVKKGWRVSYGGRTFSVEHSYEDENPLKMVLVCKEVIK